jgi:hypothetical protein
MPVIGRLDEQVNDLIIAPVSNRLRDEAQPSGRRSEEAPEASPRPASTPTQTPPVVESSGESDELPVWLL